MAAPQNYGEKSAPLGNEHLFQQTAQAGSPGMPQWSPVNPPPQPPPYEVHGGEQPAHGYGSQQSQAGVGDTNKLIGCLVVILLMFMLLVTVGVGVIGYKVFYDSNVAPVPAPDNPDVRSTRFDADVRAAMVGPNAATDSVYLAKLMTAKAGILKQDLAAGAPYEFDTRRELIAYTDKFGRFGIIGTNANVYPGLAGVITKAMAEILPKAPDGNFQAGDLTPEERQKAIAVWLDLAASFNKIK